MQHSTKITHIFLHSNLNAVATCEFVICYNIIKTLYSLLFVFNVALLWNGNHFVGNKGNNSFERLISESNLECANSIIDIHDKRIPTTQ